MRNNQRRTTAPSRSGSPPATAAAAASGGLTYQVPTEFVELPSRGRFYLEGHPLHNQETVEIKFMTAKEEDILSSVALIKKGLAVDRLLENILVEDIDPGSLLVGDRSAIMIAARTSGYGRVYETEITCPTCSAKNSFLYDLTNAKIADRCFDEQFIADNDIEINPESGLFIVELPTTKVAVGLRLLDGYSEKEFTRANSDNEESKITTLLSAFIESVDGICDRQEVEAFIDSMPTKDSKYIRNIYTTLIPNIELKDDFTCSQCFQQREMEVPLSANFFWPG
jgi:hypothetical protein